MMKKKEDGINSNQQITIALTTRHASMLVALSCVFVSSTFLVGYFWGKRSAVVQFAQKVEQDSFADQIYASLCALYDYEPQIEEKGATAKEVPSETTPTEERVVANQESNLPEVTEPAQVQTAENSCEEPVEAITADQQENLSQCYAELVGFGSERSATLFVHKLLEKGYEVFVKKRSSITAHHKKIAWYQVVTQPYQDKDALQEMVDRIAQEEKLKGIRIVFI